MTMTASPSVLSTIELAPRDPILGITEAFVADTNPNKVNLGVGVYCDDNGKVPLLECVRRAEREVTDRAAPRSYLPIDGLAAYDKATQALLFGADSETVQSGRALTVQALGGTGALKIGADFLRRFAPDAGIWISNPSWENHRALFEGAGITVNNYAYYDPATRGLDFPAMAADLERIPAGSIVVLHGCCHNPTGVDPTEAQWTTIIDRVRARRLVPFLDVAYQGFADGLEADGAVVRRFAATPGPLFVASSYSKSFSLYGERVGALTIVGDSKDEAQRALSQLKRIIRTNYSNPPTHGGQLVTTVRAHPLRAQDAGRPSEGARTAGRLRLRAAPARDVLVHRPHQGAGRAAARRVLGVRDRHRPRLRRGAELAQRRLRRAGDRQGRLTAERVMPGFPHHALTGPAFPL
jgi:aromatic-amino-acid transaminase